MNCFILLFRDKYLCESKLKCETFGKKIKIQLFVNHLSCKFLHLVRDKGRFMVQIVHGIDPRINCQVFKFKLDRL